MEEIVIGIYSNGSDHKAQLESLLELLAQKLPIPTPEGFDITEFLQLTEAVVSKETGSMVVSRQFITQVDQQLDQTPPSNTLVRDIARAIIGITQPRAISYEEQITAMRFKLASALENEGKWIDAATTLLAIPIESGQRAFTAVKKMEMYLRMGKLYLEGDATDDAELCANRASLQQAEVRDEQLNIEHKALLARVLDRRRKFIDAAQRYHELSMCEVLPNIDKTTAISSAMVCTILAAPGTYRTRLLATLSKDGRAKSVPCFGLLEKLFLDRLIRVDELLEFEKDLTPWQLNNDKGESIVRNVMIEHNMAAAGRVYDNISLETLAGLLGVNESEAERVAARMIASNRLTGHIDQLDKYVHFDERTPIELWDEQIELFCKQIEKTAGMIVAKHPELDSQIN